MLPEAADGLKATVRDNLAWLDQLLAGKQWIAGDALHDRRHHPLLLRSTSARGVGQPIDPALGNVAAWFGRVTARPSAEASLHPASAQVGMRG